MKEYQIQQVQFLESEFISIHFLQISFFVLPRMFEIKTIIPTAKDLTIRVKDWDLLTSDDVIGQTTIDLENRLLSKYRATCGLPLQFNA
jgi:hypothetical protein